MSVKLRNICILTCCILACIDYTFSSLGLHLLDTTTTTEYLGEDVFFEILQPEELSYTYRVKPARDFGHPFNTSFHAYNVRLVPVEPMYGCIEPENAEDLIGSVVLVERGECSFKTKAIVAARSGARAVLVTDLHARTEDLYLEMIDDDVATDVDIPAAYLTGRNGYFIVSTMLRNNIKNVLINLPVNLTFTPIAKINQPPWEEW